MSDRNPNGTFKIGNKFGQGRQKGSRNRFTSSMMDELIREDLHPMQELKRLYTTTQDDKIKFSILKEMLSFGNNRQLTDDTNSSVNDYSHLSEKELDERILSLHEAGLMPNLEVKSRNPIT
ncbi:hypothetical protein AB4259_00140 [Vibrio amylolyticus]|uniref:hypothetical protein n=1 Tax=Vibrio TaxID=662 RepID=UPI000C81C4FA|nr:hypothetical protein [Vibrio sp. 10N.261.55.A7]PMJ91971.1 hypothetical protein BCU12_08720 [Vibrio sp. 10N.261.55.A7]